MNIVSFGGGTNSAALLIGLYKHKIPIYLTGRRLWKKTLCPILKPLRDWGAAIHGKNSLERSK